MKTPSSVSCLLALPWLLAGPLVSSATTLTVTNLADSGPGSLSAAISNAASGDTITFATNGTITLPNGLVINKSLTITGPGPANLVVNGNHQQYSVFYLSGNTSITDSISGLTIENGVGGAGGGILNHGTLILSNCVITHNTTIDGFNAGTGGLGGGVYNDGALTMIACTVSYNSAGKGADGAQGANGSGSDNSGFPGGDGQPGGNGGGIYNEGMLSLTACTINNNTAGNGGNGGAGGNGSLYNLVGCGNGGNGGAGGNGGSGGGVFNNATATLGMTNCTVVGNAAGSGGFGGSGGVPPDLLGVPCAAFGSGGGGGNGLDGGGIYNAASASGLALTACTFSGNRAGDGGAGGFGGSVGGKSGSGGAGGNGGGIFDDTPSLVLTELRNALVAQNSSGTGGPAGSIFGGNPGPKGVAADLLGTNYLSHGYNLVGNNDGQFTLVNQSSTDIIGTNAMLAALGDNGGPTFTVGLPPGSPAIDAGDDLLTNTLATDQRGAPRRLGAHVDIGALEAQAPVVLNTNDSGPDSLRNIVHYGLANQTVTFDTNTLSGQTLPLTSGEIRLNRSLTIDASALPAGFRISGSRSSRIFEVASGATVTLVSLTLMNGSAYSGGAVLVDGGGALTVVNSTVLSNSAGFGGGLVNNGTLTLSNSIVVGNVATNNSGGVENDYGTLTILGSLISGNSALNGGGVASFFSNAVTIITNTTVSSNWATNIGGGIYNYSGTFTVNNSSVFGNRATNNGGGIENIYGGTLRVNNSTFSGNSAGGGGGAIENDQTNSTLTLINCTLSANSANSAGGIDNYGVLALTNTIVAGNTATLLHPNIYLDRSGSFSTASNIIAGNPLLAPLGNYGGPTPTMPPLPGSPAIDAGSDAVTNFLATDQRGLPRLVGAHVDIGAVEYLASPIVTTSADSGGGSLRNAVAFSTNDTTITFANNLSGQTLPLTGGEIVLNGNLTIDGSALSNGFNISGNHSSRIFEVASGASVTLASLTLMNGSAGTGGATLVDSGGALTVANSIVSSNSASYGGGLVSYGTLTLSNSVVVGNVATNNSGGVENDGGTLTILGSLISSNSASYGGGVGCYFSNAVTTITGSTLSGNVVSTGSGGAIENDDGAVLLLNNSTFSGNSAGSGGGGLDNYQAAATLNNCTLSGNSAGGGGGGIANFGTLALTNTIVASNTAPVSPDINLDISGSFSGANNLTNVNPLLAPLGSYGGPTPTMPPLLGSPAIDAGSDAVTNLLVTDQRGFPRLSGAHVDIGAVEAQAVSAASAPLLKGVAIQSGAFSFNFTNLSVADFTVLASTNVGLPSSQWSTLGAAAQLAPGQYHFTDSTAPNYPRRFYRVVSP